MTRSEAGLQEAGCFRQYPARSYSCAGRQFTMNEQVINLIVKKTGISQENAQKAVVVVFDFLKTKLPAPIASQLDSFLTGGTVNPIAEQAGGFLKSKVGGVLAGKV